MGQRELSHCPFRARPASLLLLCVCRPVYGNCMWFGYQISRRNKRGCDKGESKWGTSDNKLLQMKWWKRRFLGLRENEPREKTTSLSKGGERWESVRRKVQLASVGPVDEKRKISPETQRPLCSFVSHSRKGTAVNSRDQSIRPWGAGAPVLTVYPERNGKLESSINRTVRWVCKSVCVCVFVLGRIIGGRERRGAGFSRIMAQSSTGQWSHASRSWQTRPFPWAPISLSPLCYLAKILPFCFTLATHSHQSSSMFFSPLFCSVFLLERNGGNVFFSISPLLCKCLNLKRLDIFSSDTHTYTRTHTCTYTYTVQIFKFNLCVYLQLFN